MLPWLLRISVALFWEGQFERAIARCDETPFHALATKIACLVFAERAAEARQLFDADALTLANAPPDPLEPTAALLEAMLAFHEEDPSSQKRLDALVREAPGPFRFTRERCALTCAGRRPGSRRRKRARTRRARRRDRA